MRSFTLAMALAGCTAGTPNETSDTDIGTDSNDGSCSIGLDVGDCPPDFTLPSTSGGDVTLSMRGGERVILVGSSIW